MSSSEQACYAGLRMTDAGANQEGTSRSRVEVPGGFIPVVEVPGGFIGVDPYRGRDDVTLMVRNLFAIIAAGGFSARGVLRDVVVFDSQRCELFREGPYNAISVLTPYQRMIAEIRKSGGVQEFVRSRQVAEGQLGPIRVTSGRISVGDVGSFFWTAIKAFFRKPEKS